MKKLITFIWLFSCIVAMSWVEARTVTLSIPSMNCSMCPLTVRKALEKVDGVMQVQVDYESKSAVIEFDDQKTNIARLTDATQNAGYPSSEIKQD